MLPPSRTPFSSLRAFFCLADSAVISPKSGLIQSFGSRREQTAVSFFRSSFGQRRPDEGIKLQPRGSVRRRPAFVFSGSVSGRLYDCTTGIFKQFAYFLRQKRAVFARCQRRIQSEAADGFPVQLQHLFPAGGKHSLNLMIFSFTDPD